MPATKIRFRGTAVVSNDRARSSSFFDARQGVVGQPRIEHPRAEDHAMTPSSGTRAPSLVKMAAAAVTGTRRGENHKVAM
jgi:hypothetical protein